MTINQKLNNYIRLHGYVTYNDIVKFSNEIGCKVDTATRQLRPSDSPNVVSVKNEKGAITGYKWKNYHEFKDCYSYQRFGEYCQDCRKKVGVNNQRVLI